VENIAVRKFEIAPIASNEPRNNPEITENIFIFFSSGASANLIPITKKPSTIKNEIYLNGTKFIFWDISNAVKEKERAVQAKAMERDDESIATAL